MRGGKARPKISQTSFQYNIKKGSVPDSGNPPLAKRPHIETSFEDYQDGRNSSGCASDSLKDSKKGNQFCQIGTLSDFLDQWRSIYRFMLDMDKGPHLQLMCCPPFIL